MIERKTPFFPVLTVLFLGYLGFSLVLPLFPPLFLDPSLSFLDPHIPNQTRRILLGILFAMYPLGQFLGAPLLGKLSDKHGRKPVLIGSFTMMIPTYVGCALAITYSLPFLLFLSRFFCGLLEGNVVIAQAAVADISEGEKEKTKNFGYLTSFSSLAFFIGPLLGSMLADSDLFPYFHYDTPFWFAALFIVFGLVIVLLFFQETKIAEKNLSISLKNITSSFIDGIKLPELSSLFAIHFLLFLSIFFFINFFSSFLVSQFQFNILQIGQANAYLAFFLIFCPLIFKQFSRYFPAYQTLIIGSFFFSFLLLLIASFPANWLLLAILPLIAIGMAIGFAFPAILVSEQVGKNIQGQALGTNLSIQVLAEALTALIGGGLFAIQDNLPFLVGSVLASLGSSLLFVFFRQKKTA